MGTDFGLGSLTSSGYPRVVKEWRRGTPLAQAKLVFEGKSEDVSVDAQVVHDHGRTYELIRRGVSFFTSEDFIRRGNAWLKLDKPDDATVQTFEDQLLLRLRSDWTVGGRTYSAGALLASDFEGFLKGDRQFEVLFQPAERKSLAATSDTRHFLVINELDNVRNRFYLLKHEDGRWRRSSFPAPDFEIGRAHV